MTNTDEQILLDFAKDYFKTDKKFNSLKEEYFYIRQKKIDFVCRVIKKLIKEVECEECLDCKIVYRFYINVYFKNKNNNYICSDCLCINENSFINIFEQDKIYALIEDIYTLDCFCLLNDQEKIEIEIYNVLAEIKADYDKKELDLILNIDNKQKRSRL